MNQKTTSDPMATLYQEGRHTFVELVPDGGARLDALFHTVPALGQLAVGVVYGHLHSRPGLDPRLREAVSFACSRANERFHGYGSGRLYRQTIEPTCQI